MVAQRPEWTVAIDDISATNSAPSGSTDGVQLSVNRRGVPLHMAVKKTSTATVVAYGYSIDTATWHVLESFTFGGDSLSHAEPLEYGSAFDRIAFHVSALGAGNISVWIGELDEGPY